MAAIADFPLELIEHILFALDPLDVASFAQTSCFFRDIVYGANEQRFWRGLYLAQPLDDPRRAVTHLGRPRTGINWRAELQRIVRARAVAKNLSVCRRDERCEVLQTLLDLVANVPPLASPEAQELSRNICWVQNLLRDGAVLEHALWTPADNEAQLRARLHTCRRNHTASRAYGPFLPDGSMRVDWAYMRAIAHVVGLRLVEMEDEEEEIAYEMCPLNLAFCQSIIPPGLNLDAEDDWAGVEGLWCIGYAMLDHREFIIYNDPRVPEDEPLDTSIFEDVDETYSSLSIYFRVIGIEPDPSHPTRPQINYIGELDGKFSIVGFVKLTADDQVWWHYRAGNENQLVWNCDAIGLGNIRSQCGAVGVWSTIFHDAEDPIGAFPFRSLRLMGLLLMRYGTTGRPFWLKRQLVIEDE
ncbi:hypothetical protein BU15DRAFT_74129 [Melanogaster broomeanus]|nr:hypothetical protein BU15DRAFT_74129 [Melanogaster broomeanus]